MSFPIKNGDFPYSYVSLPEGNLPRNHRNSAFGEWKRHWQAFLFGVAKGRLTAQLNMFDAPEMVISIWSRFEWFTTWKPSNMLIGFKHVYCSTMFNHVKPCATMFNHMDPYGVVIPCDTQWRMNTFHTGFSSYFPRADNRRRALGVPKFLPLLCQSCRRGPCKRYHFIVWLWPPSTCSSIHIII